MNTILLILALFAPINLQEKVTNFIMRETVTTVRHMTRIGWELESEALVARWVLKIQLRRGLAVDIDYQRYYLAEQRVTNFQQVRNDLVLRYNLVIKFMEYRGEDIPPGIPHRIRLESTGWAVMFRYF